MIVANAYLVELAETAGGVDPVTGYARPAEVAEGPLVPCQITRREYGLQGMPGGTLLIDGCTAAVPRRFRLLDAGGGILGEHTAQTAERLEFVDLVAVKY